MNGSAHAGVIRFRFVRSATPIKGADFGGAIFSLEPRISSYSKGIEQLDTHLAVSRSRQKTFDDYTIIDQLALPCRLKYVSADWSVRCNIGMYPPIYKCRTTTTGRNYLPVVAFSFHRNCGLLIQ